MKQHGFYPHPRQNGNHSFPELNFETKLPETQPIERRIQEIEQSNERQQQKRINKVQLNVSRVNSAVERVSQKVDLISKKHAQYEHPIKKNPWDDEIVPFRYSRDD